DLDELWRRSPIRYVQNIQTPLLLTCGEMDLRCAISQSEELFGAMRLLGKTVELVRFPEESHDLSRIGRPDRRVERLRRIAGWYERFLGTAATDRVVEEATQVLPTLSVATLEGPAPVEAEPEPEAPAVEAAAAPDETDTLVLETVATAEPMVGLAGLEPEIFEPEALPDLPEPGAEYDLAPESEDSAPELQVAAAEAESDAVPELEPVLYAEPELGAVVAADEPQLESAAEPEPVVEAAPEPVLAMEAEPEVKAEPQPPFEPEPEPEPVLAVEPEPMPELEPEPVAPADPWMQAEQESAAAAETEPIIAAAEPETEPVVEGVEPEPVAASAAPAADTTPADPTRATMLRWPTGAAPGNGAQATVPETFDEATSIIPAWQHSDGASDLTRTVSLQALPPEQIAAGGGFAALLTFESGPFAGRIVALPSQMVTIGRAPDNDVVVGDPATSGHHGRIEVRSGFFWISDLGSTNGTLVNGEPVIEKQLADGDQVAIGQNTLRFTLES
ncbi:MAG TPA: FHA domain-containing protein, partial [Gemmatimonadales bacterium]|nr:FHA domain-containing protein [Gemmatimonadales bacterium]